MHINTGTIPHCHDKHFAGNAGTDLEQHSKDPYLPQDELFNERKQLNFLVRGAEALLPSILEGFLPWRSRREFSGFDDGGLEHFTFALEKDIGVAIARVPMQAAG